MTPSEKALQYAEDVVSGKIPNCRWVRLACQRFLNDLKREDWQYRYDAEKADRAVRFMEKMPHIKGKWAAEQKFFTFEPWQCFIECNLFGWVNKNTGLRRFRLSFELIPRKNGKALAVDTPVFTTKGWKNHGDLQPGDYVFGPDGYPKQVIGNSGSYMGPVHRMEFSDGEVIIAHANHEWVTNRKWYTKRPNGIKGMIPLPPVESVEICNTLRMNGIHNDFVHSITSCDPLRLPEVSLPVEPYALGSSLKDGSIPENYLLASIEQRYDLLRGLLDVGGEITKAGYVNYFTQKRALAVDVQRLLASLGIKSRVTVSGRRYRLSFTPQGPTPLFTCESRLQRQKPTSTRDSGANKRTIIGAEPCGEALVNCIEVEDSLYLAGHNLITTHNSFRAAARGIYLFCADGEPGAEVYSGATSEKQAHEIYRPAWMMVDKLPALQNHFDVSLAGNSKNPGTMYIAKDMSKFEPLIGKPGDGSSPHCALIDEYHEHDSDHMVDTMLTGMGARQQPLLCIVTTAGSNLGGPCFEMQQEMQRILDGVIQDETIFVIIYGLDAEDDWTDPATLIKANPNYAISVFPEFLLSQLEQAKRSASKQNAFRTKHLNEWVGAKTAWMNMTAWMGQTKRMSMQDFKGCDCRVSIDLSSQKDVSAVDVTFRKGGDYYSFKKFFAPEASAEENEKYMEFVSSGHLELTDGSMMDQSVIEDYLLELKVEFGVTEFTFDDWQADYMMTRLSQKKIDVIKFPFRGKTVSEPMKHLEALVLDGKYFHDGNEMMNWMMANVTAKLDTRGNTYPNKARPNDYKCKIDGVAAAIMSMGRFMIAEEEKPKYNMFFV